MHGNFEHLLLDDDGQSNFLSINISIRRFNHITSNPFMSVHVISYTIMSVQNLVFHLAGTSVCSFQDLFGIHTSNNQYRFNKVNTIFVCLFVCVFFNLITDGNPDFVGRCFSKRVHFLKFGNLRNTRYFNDQERYVRGKGPRFCKCQSRFFFQLNILTFDDDS